MLGKKKPEARVCTDSTYVGSQSRQNYLWQQKAEELFVSELDVNLEGAFPPGNVL